MRLGHIRGDECEWLARQPTILIPRYFIQERASHNANERPIPTCPVLPEWPGCITSHTTYDEQRTILKYVAHPDINARADMVFVHEYPFNNVLDYVFAYNLVRTSQPYNGDLTRQFLPALSFSELNNVIERFYYESCEIFAVHTCVLRDCPDAREARVTIYLTDYTEGRMIVTWKRLRPFRKP